MRRMIRIGVYFLLLGGFGCGPEGAKHLLNSSPLSPPNGESDVEKKLACKEPQFLTECIDDEPIPSEEATSCLALTSSPNSSISHRWDQNPQIPEEDWVVQDREIKDYWKAVERTANIVFDSKVRALATQRGLDVLPITWEDTGRYKDSAVGPNISDMTIQVRTQDPRFGEDDYEVRALPVVRYPNFSDRSTDIRTSEFGLLVGNHKEENLKKISLHDFLNEPKAYLSESGAAVKSLLAERDTHVLVSAQAVFLPIPRGQKATFNPVLFNYQSYAGNPAVLTILATREGTSVTIIDNVRDSWSDGSIWGQRLFHNAGGERASLTGEREDEWKEGLGDSSPSSLSPLNMVFLIQVPLKFKRRSLPPWVEPVAGVCQVESLTSVQKAESDVGRAVIGHGEAEGPFTELDGLSIERDSNFPVRVTVQFYKATETGEVSASDMDQILQEIKGVYQKGEVIGSLVTEGDTGRVTEYAGLKVRPPIWWKQFFSRHYAATGEPLSVARARLTQILGEKPEDEQVSDLYLTQLLRQK